MAVQTRVPSFVPFFNPIARRLLRLGPLLGPNALLGVRGRKSGQLRSTPVALVEVDGRRWIIGTFGETNWVRNLRAAGEGTLTIGRHTEPVRAVELDRAQTGSFFADTLGPFVRGMPLGAWLLGSVLHARDILDDPHDAAQRHPVFELLPAATASSNPA
jgi:deazaflavin-dependent oxidoreductase (nitroreductase family)